MTYWIAAGFVALGLLHIPPVTAAYAPETLAALYGTAAGDDGVRVLLQHRGASFALVALAAFVAAKVRSWRVPALVLTGWSMISFLGVFLAAGTPSGPLDRVALADGVGVVAWLAIALAMLRERSRDRPAVATSPRVTR